MRLVTFSPKGSEHFRVGALAEKNGEEFVVDLERAGISPASDMRSLLEAGPSHLSSLGKQLPGAPPEAYLEFASVTLGPVIANPNKIICIGLNYRDHAEETKLAVPETPTVFAKYSNTLIGSGQPIILPATSSEVDYEAELAFVIGKRAKHVDVERGLEYVAGYTILNDVSARDYQLRVSQWTIGKSFDTFAPIGPALVTRDEITNPHSLAIRLWLGDQLLQNSTTANLIFRIPELVSYLSSVMTLEPGDVVATGTPAGVGFTRKPPIYLKHGDTVRIEIDGLGSLSNPVRHSSEKIRAAT